MDGTAWRVVPDDVVVRAGLSAGIALDRPTLRNVRRELRRAEALRKAGRALARRDVSEAGLRDRLRRGGVAPARVDDVAETLRRAGALDDSRFAANRARALCDRGWGNEAILVRLDAEGAPAETVQGAIAALPPETERAARLVARLPARKAARFLARRGFDPDTVEPFVTPLD